MIRITGDITGDRALGVRLNSITPGVRKSVTTAMLRITIDLQSHIARNKLAGQLLKRRTGTLAASIQHKVVSTTDGVTGIVGSRVNQGAPLAYANVLENGFDGTVTVKAHLRNIKEAFGKQIAPREVQVASHSARRHIKAYKYMASAMAEKRDGYMEQLRKAVADGQR